MHTRRAVKTVSVHMAYCKFRANATVATYTLIEDVRSADTAFFHPTRPVTKKL